MSAPSFKITAYTPLETLLLFHNLSTHGTHPKSFSLISNILVRNPLVKSGETFDRGRLAPDALQEFYFSQLKEAESKLGDSDEPDDVDGGTSSPPATRNRKAKTPPAALSNSDKSPVVKILASQLYEQYRRIISQQIRDDERRCLELDQDIEDISAGLWDERLLEEKATRARSRSSSAIPRSLMDGRASASPSLEEQNIEPDVESILEENNKPRSSVSVEVSPRGLPTPTPQHIPRTPKASSRSPSQPPVLSRPITSPIKLEQPSPIPETPPKKVSVPASIPQPPPQIRDQKQEGLREIPKVAHPQTKREGIKAGLSQATLDASINQIAMPRQSSGAPAVPLSSSRHRALSAPIPSPHVPPKMEAVPPPPPLSTSSPVAPPLSRPLGAKIEAPVPPPTRTPFAPITPRPLQPAYPSSQTPPSRQPPTQPTSAQQQSPGHQGLSGLLQLADVADTRWQQQHTPSYGPHGTPIHPQIAYSPPGQQSPYSPTPAAPHTQTIPQGRGTPAPSTPGGGNFAIIFPIPAPATPIPSVQQYPAQYSPHSQARPISVAQPGYQHYSTLVPVQQHNFEQVPPASSPPVQRIAPRPPLPSLPPTMSAMSTVSTTPLQQPKQVSPRKTRPPPINTEVVSPRTPPHLEPPAHREPGSPIPPRPDEISPISTPSRSPAPPESPKPPIIEKTRGKKRPLQEDEQNIRQQAEGNGKEDIKQPGQPDRGREEKPTAKRQKPTKHDKAPGKRDLARGGSNIEKKDLARGIFSADKKDTARGSSNAEKKDVAKGILNVDKKDTARGSSNTEKKDVARGIFNFEKKDLARGIFNAEKKDAARGISNPEKKDAVRGSSKDVTRGSFSIEKKDMARGSSNVEKKDVTRGSFGVEKKDVTRGSFGVEKKDVTRGSFGIEKKDAARGGSKDVTRGSFSIEKKDVTRGSSNAEKKDIARGIFNVGKKDTARGSSNAEKKDVVRGSSSVEKKDVGKGSSNVEKKDVAKGSSNVEKPPENPPASEGKVKDEDTEVPDIQSPSSAVVPIEAEQELIQKPKGRGRPPKKSKPRAEERGRETVPQLKEKRSKRKRTETIAPTSRVVNDVDSEIDVASMSPTPQRRHMPKLESQNSNAAANIPSPSPLTVTIGQQPLVVATKKFLQLSAPLLGDISSHKFANLFSTAVNERMAPGYRNLVFRPQDLKSIKAAVKSGTAAITNTSMGTPAMTPTTEPFAAATPPASSSTFATLPATTLNTPPKGIVNSVQLEKELFRMFANAIMYNKSTTEIAKETVMMARDVEGMVDNFRTAEEAGMKKALGAVATGLGFGSARKLGVRDRERERDNTVDTVVREEEQCIVGEKDDGDGEDSMMDTDGTSERGKGKGGIGKRKRLKR